MSQRISCFQSVKDSLWMKGVNWEKVYHKQYKMPLRINPYESYIHNEFKAIPIHDQNKCEEQKYDKLFDFFFFLKPDPEGISECYLASGNRVFKKISDRSMKISSSSSLRRKHDKSSKSFGSKQQIRRNPQFKSTKFESHR